MSLRERYRRWARDVPEGAMRRDWRAHPLRLYRWRRFQADYGPLEAIAPTLRELTGQPPRCRRYRAMPWGHRSRYDVPLVPVGLLAMATSPLCDAKPLSARDMEHLMESLRNRPPMLLP